MNNNLRAIHYLDKHRSLVLNLSERGASNTLFSTIKDLLCFAALLGYSKDNKKPLGDSKKAPSVDFNTFVTTDDDDFIYMISAATHNDIDILREDRNEDVIEIFEEYINGGLYIIDEWTRTYNDPLGYAAVMKGLESDNIIRKLDNVTKISIDV